jgi:Amt family ammonium transporter
VRRIASAAATCVLGLALPATAAAADGSTIDAGDTAWMLMATALVMVMLPGLALFYGGLVRRKNVLSTTMHSFFGLALVSVVWVIVGFTLAFGPDVNGMGLIGGLDFAMFNGVDQEPSTVYATTIPFVLFASFQLMFAAITPALITGAFAERKRFGSFVLFTILWSILVYSPLAHWVWSVDGWLFKLGALDFAGGAVVHISSGVSALVVALMIGRRHMNGEGSEPHDVPMTVLGAGLLWFGWFGFNAGSALTAGGLAASAFTVTNVSAAAATITWVLASYLHSRKVSVVGAACGAVAGLVAVTPASGYVTVGGALVIGLVAGGLCFSATLLRARSKVDDALDVFAVHGVGGMFGAVATGIFASSTVQAAYSGLLQGNPEQLARQLIAVVATVGYAVVATVVIVKGVDLLLGIRVKPEAEEMGLDLSVHGEVAYQA